MLISFINFSCLSVREEPDILIQERQDTNHPACPNTHPRLFILAPVRCILCDQHTTMYALWFEGGKKMAPNQRTTNQRRATQFQ